MKNILCIIAIVERGKADRIVDKAKKVGAKGATILYGRGTGESEINKFLNIHIEASKEVILVLHEEETYRPVFDTIVEAGRLNDPGTGIIFTIPVSNLVGLHHREK
ncbi:P-II family nitrogen regulator [Sporanaerobacter acetigenes]|jgi:nitrogen regulatory protein P-II 1|uniref:Nitrogen regulatory protein P-II family n=1 Tax=Sporanaerobacter acetigenes DSM 13106 TaxID=1123281 RepID=A0A1M5YYH6_9FIRM|nr:P-II family nitrogen regulator [Sporanaerobacter acetigenes]SHI17077.1 nitrogen regulatory protein P-II family [Sporanaerobacter acetigenes DSM 13106]